MFLLYFIILAFVSSAFFSPSPVPFYLSFVALPLIILYELGLQVSRILERRRDAKADAD